jgi:hypothetical protein
MNEKIRYQKQLEVIHDSLLAERQEQARYSDCCSIWLVLTTISLTTDATLFSVMQQLLLERQNAINRAIYSENRLAQALNQMDLDEK